MATSSDHNVTETALDAVKCKLSAVNLGYFRDDFLTHFVPKPTRRIPLIHRGYYLRHTAIADCVDRFLASVPPGSDAQIVSLGAGFDTLFFRLMQQRKRHLRFLEIDCDSIVTAKTEILQAKLDSMLPQLDVETVSSRDYAFRCDINELDASYVLASSDLGDISRLEELVGASGIKLSVPTMLLAECVVSYLEPDAGTRLLGWLSKSFTDATAVLYDPLTLNDPFGETLQHYFAVKGCELLSLRTFQTLQDHTDRLLRQCTGKMCRVIDMNAVFEAATSQNEKHRIKNLEAFDEYADWVISNAHYGIFLATTQVVSAKHWSRQFCAAKGFAAERIDENLVLRTFQKSDLTAVQKLFQSTHLDYSCKAVTKFVNNRIRSGDLADVEGSFFVEGGHFWIVEMIGGNDREVVGSVGLKPHLDLNTAELCRLSVSKAVRRRGIASQLVANLESFAASCGYKAIHLDTIESMVTAQEFYRVQGYVEVAERVKFSTFTLVSFRKVLDAAQDK